jgi:sulfite exporter TauE/SafE
MQLWTAFMLGFAGSLHCAGMCGPLILAMPAAPGGFTRHLAGKAFYNLGRLATYGLLGIFFGLFGQWLGLAGWQRWVSIAVGLAILLSLAAWPLRTGTALVGRPVGWLKAGLGRLLGRQSLGAQFLFGGLNGLLPCGLVYFACAAATATGSITGGLEYMVTFGLGTVPMMLGLGLAGRTLHFRLQAHLQKLVPVSLGVMAALLILRGLGLGIPYLSPNLDSTRPAQTSCCHPSE